MSNPLNLTQERVCEMFDYDEEIGVLYWKEPLQGRRLGRDAGSFKHGYIGFNLSGYRYYAHQLIWLYVYGEWPERIDHKDGNGLNNELSNLRLSNGSLNQANRVKLMHGIEKHGRKFRVRIVKSGTRYNVGSFENEEEAKAAYIEAHLELFGEHSIYARK